jgi:hypothetical protein
MIFLVWICLEFVYQLECLLYQVVSESSQCWVVKSPSIIIMVVYLCSCTCFRQVLLFWWRRHASPFFGGVNWFYATPQFTSCVYAIKKLKLCLCHSQFSIPLSMPFSAIQHHILPMYPVFVPYTTVCTYSQIIWTVLCTYV